MSHTKRSRFNLSAQRFLALAVFSFCGGGMAVVAVWTSRPDSNAGAIAFAYEYRGESGIYSINLDGQNRTALVSRNSTPAWIAEAGQSAPFRLRGFLSFLTVDALALNRPVWTSAGQQISFRVRAVGRGSGQHCNEMVWFDVERKDPKPLTCLARGYREEAIDWSPDGELFAYGRREEEGFAVDVLAVAGEGPPRFITSGLVWGLAWSPDSTRLAAAVDHPASLQIYHRDGTVLRLEPEALAFGKPAWSPDGSHIVFLCYAEERIDLCTIGADGADFSPIEFPPGFPYIKQNARWSPAGDWIVFEAVQRSGYNDLFVINADGSGLVQLTAHPLGDSQPAWSPDGLQIAFVSMRDGNKEIYVIHVDGTGLRRVTQTPGDETRPAWRP